jgi:hypothetical protein
MYVRRKSRETGRSGPASVTTVTPRFRELRLCHAPVPQLTAAIRTAA